MSDMFDRLLSAFENYQEESLVAEDLRRSVRNYDYGHGGDPLPADIVEARADQIVSDAKATLERALGEYVDDRIS